MESKIINIISTVTGLEKSFLNENLNKEKLWESINHVEIVMAIEEEFDITFSQDEIAQMTTINNIFKITKQKV